MSPATSRRSRGSHSRHGRALRSSVMGPNLSPQTDRIARFHQIVFETVKFLRSIDPEGMREVRVFTAGMPLSNQHGDGLDRWHIHPPNEVVLFRVPIERLAGVSLSGLHDELRYRAFVEQAVALAVVELGQGRIGGQEGFDRLFGDD